MLRNNAPITGILGQDGTYLAKVATGRTTTVQAMSEITFQHVSLAIDDHLVIDLKLLCAADVDMLLDDPSKAAFGWKAAMSLEAMIQEMVEADLVRLRVTKAAR